MTEMTTKQAIAEVRKFAQFIKAFQHCTKIADALEQADQLVLERATRATEIGSNITNLTESYDTLVARHELEKRALEDISQDTKKARAEIMETARSEAQDIVRSATESLLSLNKQRDQVQIDLDALNADVDAATDVLKAITAKITKAQAQAKKILEGS